MHLFHSFLDSPVGRLKLIASDSALVALLWEDDDPKRVPLAISQQSAEHEILTRTAEELKGYFAGRQQSFSVPLEMRGTTFQKQVWQALLTIPFGQTRTYGEIATALGTPTASRAVGAANGRNPISIVVPCHRVVGHSGKLTGFAGGLHAKSHLLALESASRSLFT